MRARLAARTLRTVAAAPAAPSPRRPSKADVDALSRGDAAKRRGTGSRQVPHRLNAEEATAFKVAQTKGYVAVAGTGFRKERKGAPLCNLWRQLSDVDGRCAILLLKTASSADPTDVVVVDAAPLRLAAAPAAAAVAAVRAALAPHAGACVEAPDFVPPFTVLPLALAGEASEEEEREWLAEEPVWRLRPVALAFRGPRADARALAAAAVEVLEPRFLLAAAAEGGGGGEE
jgi:hypothetical protein